MSHDTEIKAGERFAFGDNWRMFLEKLDDASIEASERALRSMLGVESLEGRSFLDIGSGSGLSSLAARRLGARVHSIDYDPQSVACTTELRRRYFPDDPNWKVEEGSALDAVYLARLGSFDVVYSWGVLHHTGAMWVGIEHAIARVAEKGHLFIALYNDQGWKSHFWWFVKLVYNRLPRLMRKPYAYALGYLANGVNVLKYTLRLKPMQAVRPLLEHRSRRGMSIHRDIVDWIGGFPYEFVGYDVLESYFATRGFVLEKSARADSLGCHEMVFRRR